MARDEEEGRRRRHWLLRPENLLSWLLIFVPIAAVLRTRHADAVWVFATSCLAIIPLAGLMGRATEALAHRAGPGIGGLLNASFGNAAELIVAFMALSAGHIEIVEASITGSIIGNLLLVLGLAMFMGGLRREKQTFNKTAAGIASSMLFLGVVGLLVPTLLAPALASKVAAGRSLTDAAVQGQVEERLRLVSEWIAIVLLGTYVLKLVFSLGTHKHLYAEVAEEEAHDVPHWGLRKATAVLLVATALTAIVAEFLVGAVEHAGQALGLSHVFIGVIVIAIIGNAAEHSTAVVVAVKGKMNLALTIAVESSLQIALFVAPLLVFAGELYPHHRPLTLRFTDLEVFAVAISVAATALISADGESNWLEGAQLIAVYAVLGIAFYFV